MRTIVVAGASMSGLRNVEALRAGGWDERIVVVGDEPRMPYSRPPLSKGLWSQREDLAQLELRRRPEADTACWLLGTPVTRCDLAAGTLVVGDARELAFDGLVVATGVRPRRLVAPGPTAGRITLRTVEDFLAARASLEAGARLVVVGSGFIGCEIAASAAGIGCEVDVVSLDEEPMQRPLGTTTGHAVRRRLEQHGVRFHRGRTVRAFEGRDRVERVVLDDGSALPGDLVVECVGSVPNVEWLAGNGLDLTAGVRCDEHLRAAGAERVVVVGDVARFAEPMFGTAPRRVEHWGLAAPSGKHAAATLLADLAGTATPDRAPFSTMPSFWSDQGPVRLQGFGELAAADGSTVVEGSLDGDCAVAYTHGGRLVGLVLVGLVARLAAWRGWFLQHHGEDLSGLVPPPVADRVRTAG